MHKLSLSAALSALLLAPAAASAQGVVFAHDLRFAAQANLFSFGANTPLVQTQIGPVGGLNYSTFGMDFNTAGDTLYVIDHILDGTTWNQPRIGTLSMTTGVFSPVAAITGAGFPGTAPATGLSVDPTDETFYASKANGLFTLNPVTGVATSIGAFRDANNVALGTVIDIAVDNNGQMFAHVLGTLAQCGGALWSVDKTTGISTLVGASGVATGFAQGMDFDPTTNTLYAALYTSGGAGSYGTWNTTTGAWTQILALSGFPDPTPNGRELEMAIRAIPEPSLIGVAGLGMLALKRRRSL
jgi:hypothetical protein